VQRAEEAHVEERHSAPALNTAQQKGKGARFQEWEKCTTLCTHHKDWKHNATHLATPQDELRAPTIAVITGGTHLDNPKST
jgi:hypothetical protein